MSSKIAIDRKSKTKKWDEEDDWQNENQMEVHWDEDENLEEIWEGRKEGSSLQVEVMQKVPELVVHEHMSQGEEVECTKENNKVKGWSTEEMKDKANSLSEVDTEDEKKGKV